ncbi:enamine deaminase RidA (YjgF/YER057c/UK114 family) [Paraburkholderia sp. HC6.4b]|nr:enamine deaminase RidA (YjgF/YER057c/UK114 family) [Paraburkholderia sp. HC6.4b]MBB5453903.1 enamine deaminase RidA (YjgF/YER057c/UK114 family) [Paraburkholderia sp. Kb1A]
MIIRQGITGRLSKALVVNGFAFLSGLTDVAREFRIPYLKAVGTDKSRIAVANIWLRDVRTL